jgi:hypothetical protein
MIALRRSQGSLCLSERRRIPGSSCPHPRSRRSRDLFPGQGEAWEGSADETLLGADAGHYQVPDAWRLLRHVAAIDGHRQPGDVGRAIGA